MAAGPIPGNGIPVTIPAGKALFWSALAQAESSQFVELKDPAGTVVFTAAGASPDGHSPTQIGQGWFDTEAGGEYTLWLGVEGGSRWSSVLTSRNELAAGGKTYFIQYAFAADDGADADFNDAFVLLQWFEDA